jgi:putative peptidoglycan lipid II flippase
VNDDWSAPSIFGQVVAEPRTFVEVDPVPPMLMDQPENPWSPPIFYGPRRHRPGVGLEEIVASHAPDRQGADQQLVPPQRVAEPGPQPEASERRGLVSSSKTMALASLISRLTGFIRNIALIAALGGEQVANAYNSANSFPNMVYELLLGGVLSSVLIPLIVQAQHRDEDGGDGYTQRLLSIATAVLGVTTLVAVVAAPLITAVVVQPGAQRSLTSIFATLLLPEIFFYGLGALFTAVLNTRGVYGPGAWAPVINNVVTILTVAIFLALPGPRTLTPSTMTTAQILVVGIGTTLGIVGQALVLVPSLRRSGFHWQWRFKGRPSEAGRLREAGSLTGWILGYVVASQIGLLFILRIGNDHDGLTIFTTADLLFQMPYGILVVSLLTALMPRMSRAATRGDYDAVKADLALGARLSAIGLLPITAGLIALGPAFTTVFLAHGQTTIVLAHQFGVNLALAAFGLLPFALVMLQLRVFYALRDGRTPTLINIFMVGTKLVLLVLAVNTLGNRTVIETLNVATSASYLVGAIVGHVLLTRRFGHLGFREVARTSALIGAASAVGGLVAYVVVHACTGELGDGRGGSLVGLLAGALAGLLVLALICWRLPVPELVALRTRISHRRRPHNSESGGGGDGNADDLRIVLGPEDSEGPQ